VLPFSAITLDRAATLRTDPEWVATQLRDERARIVAASSAGVLADGASLLRGPVELGVAEPILLGLEAESPLFAVDLDRLQQPERLIDGGAVIGLREAGAQLAPAEAGLAAYLASLLAWHRRHGFCANCGARSEVRSAGMMRECPRCGAQHFPRVDPVVIMTVENSGRLLLGRHAGWPPGRYSVLAGFVAPGETIEAAIAREVGEESGIEIESSAFVTSQPWPFPASLMLGCEAVARDGEPKPLDGELEDVRWFSADAIAAAEQANASLRLPPRISIARFLIERWARRTIGS
jgi:NAD+ diphosphatase